MFLWPFLFSPFRPKQTSNSTPFCTLQHWKCASVRKMDTTQTACSANTESVLICRYSRWVLSNMHHMYVCVCVWQTVLCLHPQARTDTGLKALFSTVGLPSFCFLILVDCRAVFVLHNLLMAILCFILAPFPPAPHPTAFLVCKYVVSKEEKDRWYTYPVGHRLQALYLFK